MSAFSEAAMTRCTDRASVAEDSIFGFDVQ
jgi:hypothetical protein